MSRSRDLLWLFSVIALAAMMIVYIPYEGPPSRSRPEPYRFYCSGKNAAQAYTGFPGPDPGFVKCHFDDGLLDHP